jgi:hypothetical protein
MQHGEQQRFLSRSKVRREFDQTRCAAPLKRASSQGKGEPLGGIQIRAIGAFAETALIWAHPGEYLIDSRSPHNRSDRIGLGPMMAWSSPPLIFCSNQSRRLASMIAKLLGHRQIWTTALHADLADDAVRAFTARGSMLSKSVRWHSDC